MVDGAYSRNKNESSTSFVLAILRNPEHCPPAMSNTYPNPQTPAPNERTIANLPEPPAGTKWVYRGRGWNNNGEPCPNGYAIYGIWFDGKPFTPPKCQKPIGDLNVHYWEAVTIPASTPMEKLEAHFETQEFRGFINLVDEALDGEPLLICKNKAARTPAEAVTIQETDETDYAQPDFVVALPEPPAGTRWVYRGRGWDNNLRPCTYVAVDDYDEELSVPHYMVSISTCIPAGFPQARYWEAVPYQDTCEPRTLSDGLYGIIKKHEETIKKLRTERDGLIIEVGVLDRHLRRLNDTIEELRTERDERDELLEWKRQEIERLAKAFQTILRKK